ncbi:MAG: hypothetical protein ACLR5H_10980 [Oscillospiraceae bacterium]
MAKMKFPNPKFFRAKGQRGLEGTGPEPAGSGRHHLGYAEGDRLEGLRRQAEGQRQDNVRRVVREAKTIAAMTPAERLDLLKTGESTWAPCTARATWSPCAASGAAWPTPPMTSRSGCGRGACCWAPSPGTWSRP